MKKHILTIIFFTFIMCTSTHINLHATSQVQNNDFQLLMEKIRQDFAINPPAEEIEEALATYNEADGSFTDVDYASIQRTNWPPLTHVDRLYDFAFAYTTPENKYYKDEKLFTRIVKGLEYWYERNPWCHNWWYNQIAEPQRLGVMLIQLRTGNKRIPAELESKTLERIKKDGGDPAKWTGANRTDIALHWIYRACLSQNETDLETALENVYNPIVYTTKEGFQHDNSYFQHGQQLYIGGYGDEILKGITQVAMYTRGTRYAIPQEKLALLSKFMRETYYPTIRGQYMLFDVLGRGVSRPKVTDKSHTALFARRMVELDGAHADEFKAIIARLEGKQPAEYKLKSGHTHYFRGDYTLHIRPGYTFDVRMVSTRTARCEYGNGENLKTYFMSDGCTNIVTAGNEYAGIFPVWNWARIPGVTAPQLQEIPKAASDWQTPGTSTFAGGVSDSLYGVSAYSYIDTYDSIHTGARKAWFFFDEEVVCLGADIHSASDKEINTSINQCLSAREKKAIVCSKGKRSILEEGSLSYNSPKWILHDGVAYLFPEKADVFVSKQTQSGNWYDINRTATKEMQQKEVFTLGINHGTQPSDATYAYLVVPGKDTPKAINKYRKKGNIEIAANTADVQVVRNKDLGIWGMVFYNAGEFKHRDIQVAVDKACVLMIKENGPHTAALHIADPGQTEADIQVSLTLPGRSKAPQTILCSFKDSGIYAGATKAYDIRFKKY